ncbi:MAG: hypothetical protein IPF51_03660 [Dehalococcoidia bacterium]|uniref:hypothetical protein n=1 Tax=Candidatus Amarobacter glycogenicus TaxID=3140699 RepID=UPI0031362DBE|nr:hypothetical protein [Dehalococcoidia bacterium]
MPCDPLELAVLLDDAVDQVVVSPPHAANGPGARTQTAALDIYKDRGWGEWLDPLRLSEVINVLRQLLGNDRVIEGRAGFNPADATAG